MKNEFNQLQEVITLSLQEAKNSISRDVQKELGQSKNITILI
jgi:hypothetical protein